MSGVKEELWQAYSPQGEPTSPISKQQAAEGTLHGAAHLWIWRNSQNGTEILVQRRHPDKPTWPGYFDVSAAGHVDAGETPLAAAIREAKEEIGLDISANDLELLFVYRIRMVPSQSIIENELQWVYGLELQNDTEFSHDDGEVESVEWLGIRDFKRLVRGELEGEQMVPHSDLYFAQLLAAIEPPEQLA